MPCDRGTVDGAAELRIAHKTTGYTCDALIGLMSQADPVARHAQHANCADAPMTREQQHCQTNTHSSRSALMKSSATVVGSKSVHLAVLFFGLLRLAGYGYEPLLAGRDIHRAVGEPMRVGVGLSRPDDLRVVSWNIARGTRFDQVREVLAGLDADVYVLQEVDWDCRRSGDRSIASDLAEALNLNWVFAGEFQEIGEGRPGRAALTGQAILSRYPIEEISVLRFERQAALRWNLDPFQPRRGGRIALRARSGGVVVYNAHIESARDDRFRVRQVNEILADHVRKPDSAAPLILAGDLNTGPPQHSPVVQSIISAGLTDALGGGSEWRKTSMRHQYPLDWIFVKSLEAAGGHVSDHGQASDHFPLFATLSVPSLHASLVP